MLTPREKSPLPENVPRGGSNPRRCGQRAQALPTELFRPPTTAVVIVVVVKEQKCKICLSTEMMLFTWVKGRRARGVDMKGAVPGQEADLSAEGHRGLTILPSCNTTVMNIPKILSLSITANL